MAEVLLRLAGAGREQIREHEEVEITGVVTCEIQGFLNSTEDS